MINLSAQSDKFEFDTRNYIGGSLSLQLGTVILFNITPHYGFYLTPRLSAGAGLSYLYYNNASPAPTQPNTLNIYGGSLFMRFDIFDQLYVHAENELLTYKLGKNGPQILSNNVLIGAGYKQFFSMMTNDNVYLMVLFNLNETQYTPYINPVIRMGVEFHF